jgi:hypothetical protein
MNEYLPIAFSGIDECSFEDGLALHDMAKVSSLAAS